MMTTARDMHVEGLIDLYTPKDWFDLLAEPDDEKSASRKFSGIIRLSYPQQSREFHDGITQALLEWRNTLLESGMIMHGLVSVPDETEGDAAWQVSAGIIALPETSSEIDLGVVLRKTTYAHAEGKPFYAEAFPTKMGFGFGLISQPSVSPTGVVNLFPDEYEFRGKASNRHRLDEDVRIGLSVALSCPPEGGKGLLVVGNCLDPNHVLPLAATVGTIAGYSSFSENRPADHPDCAPSGPEASR